MRLSKYDVLDEILKESRIVSSSHNGTLPISWMPDRLKLLAILGTSFANEIFEVVEKMTEKDICLIDMFPSEYVKAAHNLQLSVKQTDEIDSNRLLCTYKNLMNYAVVRRKYLYDHFELSLLEEKVPLYSINNETERKLILYLNTILRACSEMIFFDNHTSAGDVIGPIPFKKNKILVKSFNSIVSEYIFPESTFKPLFRQINVYMLFEKLDANFDMIGNYTSDQDINKFLSQYCVEIIPIKGTPYFLDAFQTEYIIKAYIEIIKEYNKKISMLSGAETIQCVLKCLVQVYKQIFDYYNKPFDIKSDDLKKIIEEYEKDTFYSTEELFSLLSHDNVIETIINPRIKIIRQLKGG